MRPSKGIIASAVAAIGGSILSLLLGVLMLFTLRAALVPPPGLPPPAIPMGLILGIMAGIYAGFGVWGMVSAIGLLRLRNWARICFAIFGGILAGFSLFGAFGMLMAGFVAPQPLPPEVSPALMTGILAIFAAIALLCAALGIWWVIFFNRQRVKTQFMSEVAAAAPRLFPVSITVIAWFLIVGGVSSLVMVAAGWPIVLFGFVFRGLGSRIVLLLFVAVNSIGGIGLLKKRVEALGVAIGYFVFGLVNTVSFWVVPGSLARMQDAMRELSGGQAIPMDLSSTYLQLMMLLPTIAMVAALWLLIKARPAFGPFPPIKSSGS